MANWKKIGIISGIGAGVVGALTYASRLNRASKQLQTIIKANVHSLKIDGLTIRVDAQIKNPNAMAFNIKFPFVKIIYKDKVIGTSQVIDKTIKIPKDGEVNIEAIMIKVPFTSIFSLGAGLIKLLAQQQAAKISVQTISTIDLGWKKLPYENTEDMTLNPIA